MHKRNMFINSASNIVYLLITTVFSIIIRKLLIEYLGVEILGLNGVIVELINALSLSELGIQTAIIFRLYEPVVQNNNRREGELFTLFKRAYSVIGCVILVMGLVLLPMLKYVIDVNLPMNIVVFVYMVQLSTIVLSYCTCYYRVIFLVHEQQYFCSRIDILVQIASYILQIIILIELKNYIIYLFVDCIRVIIGNILIKIKCRNKFPYIFEKHTVSKTDRKNLFEDLKEILFGNVAGYVYSSTDGILISIFGTTIMVGYLSNYKMITNMIRTLVTTINNSIAPTWGTYLHKETCVNKIEVKYQIYNFIQFVECCCLLVPVICLSDSFIKIMFGEEYIVRSSLLYLIVADIYIQNMHEPNAVIIRGKGMFKQDKMISILATCINIVFSIVLANCFGPEGVLIGTLFALVVFWGMRSWYVHKECGFEKKSYVKYWWKNIIYIFEFICLTIMAKNIMGIILLKNALLEFIVQGLVIECIVFGSLFVVYGRNRSIKDEIRHILN